jgi:hypothetical protein
MATARDALAALAALGAQYKNDHTRAPQLLAAIKAVRAPDQGLFVCIDQELLNIHWQHDDTFAMLMEINDEYHCAPEPLERFLQDCWDRKRVGWHHFIAHAMPHDLEKRVYDQFEREGATYEVLESIYWLNRRGGHDDKVYRLIKLGMLAPAPCLYATRLWSRYAPLPDPGKAVLKGLEGMLGTDRTALRIAEHLEEDQLVGMLDTVAALAPTRARAARIILEMGKQQEYAARVADAVRPHGFYEYLLTGHRHLLYQLLDMLRDNDCHALLYQLYWDDGCDAVPHGVFTCIMEMGGGGLDLRCGVYNPMGVHHAVHYMYFRGQVPAFSIYFHQALREHPDAVANIAKRAPLIHAAVRWANAKLLACCLARSERPAKRAKRCGDADILVTMQRYHGAWEGVLSFLY